MLALLFGGIQPARAKTKCWKSYTAAQEVLWICMWASECSHKHTFHILEPSTNGPTAIGHPSGWWWVGFSSSSVGMYVWEEIPACSSSGVDFPRCWVCAPKRKLCTLEIMQYPCVPTGVTRTLCTLCSYRCMPLGLKDSYLMINENLPRAW